VGPPRGVPCGNGVNTTLATLTFVIVVIVIPLFFVGAVLGLYGLTDTSERENHEQGLIFLVLGILALLCSGLLFRSLRRADPP
jgi:divalent metal cation (Fe/Co/Zn/Cd) transporter